MKSVTGHILALLACLLVLPGQTAAADALQYDIELLVFRNLVNSDDGEVWRDDYSDSLGVDAVPAGSRSVNWLAASDYRLAAHEATLRGSAQYRPIAHLAWRQSVEDRKRAQPVDLSGQAGSVSGTATVAVERYLHLSLDLALDGGGSSDAVWPEPLVSRYRLVEQRRMRSTELHYFDHPRFGVLALITPHEASP